MNEFIVKFWRKGKPTGARRFLAHASTFEEVLFDFTLRDMCESNYYTGYEWFYLNEVLFVKRIKASGPLCEYEVLLYEMQEGSKLKSNYQVEIECVFNDNSVDIFEQSQDLKEPTIHKPFKEKQPTKWFIEEDRATRNFLLFLHNEGDLKELKRIYSKASYHRNLKVCRDKGYIVGDKLAKRIFVSKGNVKE